MASQQDYVLLPGSERQPLDAAAAVGQPDPNERITVTVMLHPNAHTVGSAVADIVGQSPRERRHMTRTELAAVRGADPAAIEQVRQFAQVNGLTVVSDDPARRRVVLSGTVASFEAAFKTHLAHFEHAGGRYRGRVGALQVPAALAPSVQAVLGLDDRPQAEPHFERTGYPTNKRRRPTQAATSFTPVQVAGYYDFPTSSSGAGQCIGIIELGGGFSAADLQTYFTALSINPAPTVVAVPVDGGANAPTGDPGGPDGEVMLDIEVAGAVAPGAKIAVYFAANTDQGFVDAITQAIHDAANDPSVLSISWGSAESNWTQQAIQAMDSAFQDAAALGVTICVASGDNGSGDAVNDGKAHCDFPASDPFALGCGGTRITVSGGAITSEVVWQGHSGGGISDVFPVPSWQNAAKLPPSANGGHVGRGVPDAAGDADPAAGYQLLVDGQQIVVGGTSAVAPLWAGLIACINAAMGKRVGYLNPTLYGLAAGALIDITSGSNDSGGIGGYSAGPGWDACTGLGRPDGKKLLDALQSV